MVQITSGLILAYTGCFVKQISVRNHALIQYYEKKLSAIHQHSKTVFSFSMFFAIIIKYMIMNTKKKGNCDDLILQSHPESLPYTGSAQGLHIPHRST